MGDAALPPTTCGCWRIGYSSSAAMALLQTKAAAAATTALSTAWPQPETWPRYGSSNWISDAALPPVCWHRRRGSRLANRCGAVMLRTGSPALRGFADLRAGLGWQAGLRVTP